MTLELRAVADTNPGISQLAELALQNLVFGTARVELAGHRLFPRNLSVVHGTPQGRSSPPAIEPAKKVVHSSNTATRLRPIGSSGQRQQCLREGDWSGGRESASLVLSHSHACVARGRT